MMPSAQIFLYFVPVQASWMLPISAGITVLFMLMTRAGCLPAAAFRPRRGRPLRGWRRAHNFLLRMRVWWIDRRLRRSRLRVVRRKDDDSGPFSGTGARGSDKFLH